MQCTTAIRSSTPFGHTGTRSQFCEAQSGRESRPVDRRLSLSRCRHIASRETEPSRSTSGWQTSQSVSRFPSACEPPCARGTMWWTCSRNAWVGVAPQCTQRWPSRWRAAFRARCQAAVRSEKRGLGGAGACTGGGKSTAPLRRGTPRWGWVMPTSGGTGSVRQGPRMRGRLDRRSEHSERSPDGGEHAKHVPPFGTRYLGRVRRYG
jgi:hypothetical protein